jgi:hypothetical protein
VSLYNHGSSAYEGDDYSYPNSDGSHYHEVPLGSFTPTLLIIVLVIFKKNDQKIRAILEKVG